jgi:creatinine amidohydrolase
MTIRRPVITALMYLLPLVCSAQSSGVYFGDLTWPEAERRLQTAPLVILPFGAGAKEHGPHLPMNADAVVMQYLLDRAVESRNIVVAPPVLHGWFPAFRDFPGTEVADAAVFSSYIQAVGMSLVRSGAQRLVFLNTGIDKATGLPISIAAREIRVQTGVPTLVVSWGDLETVATETLQQQREGGHGDEIETSINLFLQPENVHMDRAITDYGDRAAKTYRGYQPGVFSSNESDPNFSESGIYGDATLGTAEKGRQALEIMTTEWLSIIDGFGDTPTRKEKP